MGVCLTGLAFLLDDPVARLLELHTDSWLRQFASVMSRLGEGWVIAAVGLLYAAWFWTRRRYETARLALLVGTVSLLSGAAATVLRSFIGRTRPDAHVTQGFYGVWHDSHWIIGQHQFGAFPSGHAATVAGLGVALWIINRRWFGPAAFYAALVCWSRIARGAHHFSDITAATVLAIGSAPWLLTLVRPWINRLLPNPPHRQTPGGSEGKGSPSTVADADAPAPATTSPLAPVVNQKH